MSAVIRPTGVILELDPGVGIAEVEIAPHARTAGGLYRSRGPAPVLESPVVDALVAGLVDKQLAVVDSFDLVGRGGARVGLHLDGNEVAVVLLERDGLYEWVYPKCEPVSSSQGEMEFRVCTEPARTRGLRGPIVDLVVGKVRAYVLKFVARLVGRAALKFIESHRQEGLVVMNGAPGGWQDVHDAAVLDLPRDRPARILLFLHGPLSSTRGDFGVFGSWKAGEGWLAAARSDYDVVLGYDHHTIAIDPLDNAKNLASRLARLPNVPVVDAIGYSRGALVVRSLVELIPAGIWFGNVRKAVLVGAPNAGTRFADPARWEHLADLYTNLVSLGCNALSLFAPAAAVAQILKESVSSLASFVNYLASVALDQRVAPGLAAMAPEGDFLHKLNQVNTSACDYYAIESDFDLQLLTNDFAAGAFPRRLVLWLTDVVADAFIGVPNDLVVDTDSMAAVRRAWVDKIRFQKEAHVHHRAYFMQPKVVEVLGAWLGVGTAWRRHSGMR